MTAFESRMKERRDELEWLYMELYHDRTKLESGRTSTALFSLCNKNPECESIRDFWRRWWESNPRDSLLP